MHILLQQLPEPAMQAPACGLLTALLDVLLPAVPAGTADADVVMLDEQDNSGQQDQTVSREDRVETLAELLPYIVSAVSEALEACTAAAESSRLPYGGFGLPGGPASVLQQDDPDPGLESYVAATSYNAKLRTDERTAAVQEGRPALVRLLLRAALGAPEEVQARVLPTCRLLPELPELRPAVALQQVSKVVLK